MQYQDLIGEYNYSIIMLPKFDREIAMRQYDKGFKSFVDWRNRSNLYKMQANESS